MLKHVDAIETPVGRLAPSPTGRIHAGNILSFLVAWLFVKQKGGTLALRIEDLDASRSRTEYADQIMRDLELLGITWDSGPIYQSKRLDLYHDALRTLNAHTKTYPCFCSRASISAASAPHRNNWQVYPNTCRNLSPAEQAAKEKELANLGRAAAIRIQVPNKDIAFLDAFQGMQQFNLEQECGDFVIQRSDNTPSYNVAVVVDDADMGINTVVRGADLCAVTPQQIYLYSLLGLKPPNYAHHAVLLAPDGRRIAKRNHDASIDELLKTFKHPSGLIGYCAYLLKLIEAPEPCMPHNLLRYAHLESLKNKEIVSWPETLPNLCSEEAD